MNVIQQKARFCEGCNAAQIHVDGNPAVLLCPLIDGVHKHPVGIGGVFGHL